MEIGVTINSLRMCRGTKEFSQLSRRLLNHFRDHPEVIKDRFKDDDLGDNDLTWLHRVAGSRLDDLTKQMIELGWDSNARTQKGAVPLYFIFLEDLEENPDAISTAKVLLEHGANPDAATASGDSLLHRAFLWGFLDIARMLVRYGANYDIYSSTLLALDQVISILLAKSSDPISLVRGNFQLVDDLIHCSRIYDPELGRPIQSLRLLLANGLNPNSHVSAISSQPMIHKLAEDPASVDLMRELIQAGADVNPVAMDASGPCTPLDIAINIRNQKGAAVLRAAGGMRQAQMTRKSQRRK